MELAAFTKSYLFEIRQLVTSSNTNVQLIEYFDYLANRAEWEDRYKSIKQKSKQTKLNETLTEQNRQLQSNFDTSNTSIGVDYCAYCKLSYWPNNCIVYIEPKLRMSNRSAKTIARVKLFEWKPKYNSYKDRLVKRILDKGIRLIYKCKRCGSKNIMIKEFKRDVKNMKFVRFGKQIPKTQIKNTLTNVKLNKIELPSHQATSTKSKGYAIKKKHLSLQLKLNQNEQKQREINEKKKCQSGSLADFLLSIK
jgi:hypothetical protein